MKVSFCLSCGYCILLCVNPCLATRITNTGGMTNRVTNRPATGTNCGNELPFLVAGRGWGLWKEITSPVKTITNQFSMNFFFW